MSNLATCPDRDEIDRLRLGRLSLEQAAALDEHLLACEPCCQVLHELDSSDLLGETLGTLRTRESAIDDRVRAVMARLKEMTLPGKAIEETLVRGRDATTDAWDLEKLLDPPQAEGELGRFAGYRVLRVLGAGGMGLVLEAEDPQLRRRVALKVMQRALAAHEENRQRFLREARATAAIEHAHIVTVHQVGVHNGLPFLAMQLLKGESLQDRVERARSGKKEDGLPSPSRIESDGLGRPSSLLPLPPGEGPGEGAWERSEVGQSDGQPIAAFLSPHPNPLPEGEGTRRPHSHPLAKREEPQRSLPLAEVLRIGREIAEALAEAHARNLIHRDIKPGNIWLEGASGWVKLVDFGLAHAAEDVHLTQTGAILGTPAYMSPEQARGETVDGRSDLYSLGAVLYKLTTGDVPFRGASTMAVLMALATETPRPPIELNPDIPPALNDLILRLLAKKPADRYESAMAVAEAIRQIEASRVGIAHHRVADATDANPASATHSHGPGGQCPPYGRRPRWPLVAAAAAAAFLLATIVIIVRDKDGKELFRGIVPDGGSLTVTAGDAATKIEPKLPDSSVPPKGEASPPSRRAGIAEPPPLEEWLRGRTMLTVAQDGSGQFKTIQAALDALQAGQVVKVLDRGPYREQLNVRVLPADTGLVSEVGTSIEPPAYGVINKGSVWEAEVAHYFRQMEGFRLAGFTIASPEPGAGRNGPNTFCLDTFCCEGFVLERCWLRGTAQFHVGGHAGDGGKPACVRECLIENMLHVASRDNDDAVVLVARNLFVGANAIVAIGEESIYRHIGVTDNVFAGPKEGLEIHSPKHFGRLEITNNTFLGSNPIRWLYFDGNAVAAGEAIIVNNLRLRPGLLALLPGPTPAAGDLPAQIQGAVRQSWHVARNCYPRDLRPGDSDYQVSVVKFPGDILGVPRLLSMVADNRDYLRPVADDAIARRGAGGEWPDYIGALPPGPAPKEGDWFTRLRERWTSVGWALPTTEPNVGNARPAIPEPPPLEEWLKGRTVLTVAQDGSGQFKTIQSALNALKPHQVVKVLDRGPYRESIQSGGLPDDTGLISDRQATVETLAWPDGGEAHAIGPVEKFRLAGIRFVAPPRDSWGTLVFCGEPSGLVVEDCCFSLTAALDPSRSMAGLGFTLANDISDDSPIVVRDCLFDYAILSIAGVGRSTFVIERNYFRNSNVGLGDRLDQAIVRHNVFDGEKACFWIQGLSDIGRMLEIRNNTAATGVTVVSGAPLRGVSLRNNITGHDVNVDEQVYKLRGEMAKNWRRDHNSYLRRSLFAKSPTDVTVDPAYLSLDPADRNYLRIPADGPQATGGAGGELPTYMGALPPGPAPKEGDWFTRLRERWTDVGWALPATQPKLGNAHPTIAEPPPLEEWLKGREVLTVSQDGSGRFKTIKEALEALLPGQVVRVLDRGPYPVSLNLANLADDIGLVSDRQTVLEISAWIPETPGSQHLAGMHFAYLSGFRLHGFTIVAKKPPHGTSLAFGNCADVVVDDCIVREAGPDHGKQAGAALSVQWFEGDGKRGPVWVRDSGIEGMLRIGGGGADSAESSVMLARNYLYRRGSSEAVLIEAGNLSGAFVMRDNVLETRGQGLTWSCAFDVGGPLVMVNNSILARGFSLWGDHLPDDGLIANNLFEVGIGFSDGPAQRAAVKDWRVGPNAYLSEPGSNELLRPRPTDLSGDMKLLSRTGQDRDFLRPRADSPLASAGAGGDLPGYIGAVPPGSAPKEGDSFTRLQERWHEADAAVDTLSSR